MMNLKRLLCGVLAAAGAIVLCVSASYAQAPQIVAVGSSGVFTTIGIAMTQSDPTTGATMCGSNVWTAGSAIAQGIDARNASIPAEGGNIVVVWDNSSSPNTVCAYLSVDSVVGQRLFLGQSSTGNATLNLTSAATSTAGANKISYLKDTATTGLPTAVYNLLNGAHFNIAFTDIRPEDGQLAYGRAACNRAGVTDDSCFGYGPLGGIGTAIASSYSQTSAQVVAYSISGTDPFSGLTIPAFNTVSLGADPVIVFYNTSDTATGGLGNLLPTNITSEEASLVWSGLVGLTDQLVGASTGSGKVLHVVQREPVSGTYNTFEWQMIHSRDDHGGDYSQEYGFGPTPAGCFTPPSTATYVPPTVSCANPANAAGTEGSTYGGFRTRAIGTGEMVSAVSSSNNPDSIGYAFWGLGTFGGKPNVKYLAVNGADPLYPNYATSSGAFPACSGFFNTTPAFSCTGTLPTFDNVKNGGYRVWSTIRGVVYQSYTAPSTGPSVYQLISAAQDQAHVNIPDFVPSVYCVSGSGGSCTGGTATGMPTIRSHYAVSGKQANNGTTSTSGFCASDQTAPNCIEEGGDMAGKPFYIITDEEFFSLTGNEFLTWIQ